MMDFTSFPQVLGHEVVADVVEVGAEAEGLSVGDRVVLNPWLSCAPRGISPLCPACEVGDLSLCWHFTDGPLAPGIHIGTSKDLPGGYANLMTAHHSMLFKVPDSMPDEIAVFADPFAVSLHSITRHPPTPDGRALVYGAGALGSCAVAILRALYPDVEVGVVARFDSQRRLAEKLGASRVFQHEPREAAHRGDRRLVGRRAARRPRPAHGVPGWRRRRVRQRHAPREPRGVHPRAQGARHAREGRRPRPRSRGSGRRCTSRSCRGAARTRSGSRRSTASASTASSTTSTSRAAAASTSGRMLTHTFPLEGWRDAFGVLATQADSGAIKVAFDQRS